MTRLHSAPSVTSRSSRELVAMTSDSIIPSGIESALMGVSGEPRELGRLIPRDGIG
jgi:hypothetical protein